MSQQLHDTGTDTSIEKEVRKLKETLAHVLREKALSKTDLDNKQRSFLYLLASIVSKLDVKYVDSDIIMATDGDNIIVGRLYPVIKSKVSPELWKKLRIALIAHEALHVMYAHTSRIKLVSDPLLYNIVADLLVNTVIEQRLRFPMPKDFVTLSSLPDFIEKKLGKKVNKDVVLDIATKYLDGKLSTEDVYRIFEKDELLRDAVKELFSKSPFFGGDISDETGAPISKTGSSQGEKTGINGAKQEEHEENLGEVADRGEEIEKKLKDVRDEIGKILEEIRKAMGEFRALDEVTHGKKRSAGTLPGVLGEEEYRKMKLYTVPIEMQFLKEVADTVSDYETSFTRFDDDAYWLPAEEEIRRSRVLLFLDSSPSIAPQELQLFMNFVRKAMELYDVEYIVSVFSVDEVQQFVLTPDNFNETKFRVKRGFGTAWGIRVIERIREAAKEGIGLIQILSDFAILVEPEIYNEIRRFKATGGRISCYSVTGEFLDFCDFKHELKIP